MKISHKTIKALKILDVPMEEGLTARDFAEQMWADSDGWQRVKNTGDGACSGKGMWLSAGGYLSKLRAAGLIQPSWYKMSNRECYINFWRISEKGEKILNITVDQCTNYRNDHRNTDYHHDGECRAWERGKKPTGAVCGICQINTLKECDCSRPSTNLLKLIMEK